MLSLGETTEAVVVWHLCSLEKLLNMPCSFLDCCPFPGFRILSGILGSSSPALFRLSPLYPIDYVHRWTMSSDPTTQTLVN